MHPYPAAHLATNRARWTVEEWPSPDNGRAQLNPPLKGGFGASQTPTTAKTITVFQEEEEEHGANTESAKTKNGMALQSGGHRGVTTVCRASLSPVTLAAGYNVVTLSR